MNAKKIMGAVLVALLAAALFVGAGAAGIASYNGNTIFVGQICEGLEGTTWTNGDHKITFNADGYISGTVTEGKYTYNDTVSMNVLYPTVIITAVATDGNVEYNLAGNTYYKYADILISLKSPATAGGNITDLLITNPDGSKIKLSEVFAGMTPAQTGTAADIFGPSIESGSGSKAIIPGDETVQQESDKALIDALFPVNGEYKIQGVLSNNLSGGLKFAPGILNTDLIGKDVFTFTVADGKDVTISAAADSILQGERFSVTVTGQPGEGYKLFLDSKVTVYSGIDKESKEFTMPNSGSITIYLNAVKDGESIIGVAKDTETSADADVTVNIAKGQLTAAAEKDAYFIGEDIKLSGINNLGGTAIPHFYIKGTNTPLQLVDSYKYNIEKGEWSATIKGTEIRDLKLDAGTYTIYVTTNKSGDFTTVEDLKKAEGSYATASVNLKQPFISVTKAPAVVVQGEDAKIEGIAEAAKNLSIYIFGTNKFAYQQYNTQSTSEPIQIELKKDNTFVITIEGDFTEQLDAGQYFAVIQHPMYDGLLNIYAYPDGEGNLIVYEATVDGSYSGYYYGLFDVADRQKANAAQALCDELDGQKLDDMYVKLSFVVAAGTSTINPIPSEIVKGEKLVVSGQTNGGEGTLVTVDMMSTAFAAVPKETVGSASFISLTTKTDENGNWEVTFDTTGLNIDEYTVSAAVDGFDSSSTVKVNVIEGADTPDTPDTPDVPDTPDTPDEPEAPATPGFGALAALAGLGAVAVLLLRRE